MNTRKNRRRGPDHPAGGRQSKNKPAPQVRIVGGRFRGRRLAYSGDPRIRPMKDRLREALFNRLGSLVEGKLVVDLFAGTGAVAIESLSRGAARAVLFENHYPTLQWIGRNVAALGLEEACELVFGDVFLWARRTDLPRGLPWLVFCCPPYEYYRSRREELLELLSDLLRAAPAESVFVAEADLAFDFSALPRPEDWSVHAYRPARIGILIAEGPLPG